MHQGQHLARQVTSHRGISTRTRDKEEEDTHVEEIHDLTCKLTIPRTQACKGSCIMNKRPLHQTATRNTAERPPSLLNLCRTQQRLRSLIQTIHTTTPYETKPSNGYTTQRKSKALQYPTHASPPLDTIVLPREHNRIAATSLKRNDDENLSLGTKTTPSEGYDTRLEVE